MVFLPLLRAATLAAALAAVAGCAVFHPPIDAPSAESTPPLEVRALRADADGLQLALQVRQAVAGDQLQIWRKLGDDDWTRVQTIDVEETMIAALADGEVQWRDDSDTTSSTRRYRLEKHRDDSRTISIPLDIEYGDVPHRPDASGGPTDSSPPQITLTWDGGAPFEARILRRDVLADTPFEALAIVDPAAGAEFIDTGVSSGGVYAYRVQFIDRQRSVARFGPYTEPFYVSVPE